LGDSASTQEVSAQPKIGTAVKSYRGLPNKSRQLRRVASSRKKRRIPADLIYELKTCAQPGQIEKLVPALPYTTCRSITGRLSEADKGCLFLFSPGFLLFLLALEEKKLLLFMQDYIQPRPSILLLILD
jgi:hypothetical protein